MQSPLLNFFLLLEDVTTIKKTWERYVYTAPSALDAQRTLLPLCACMVIILSFCFGFVVINVR